MKPNCKPELSARLADPARPLRLCLSIGLLACLALSLQVADFNPALLIEPGARASAADFIAAFWPPRTDADFLQTLLTATLATISMATVATVMALLVAAPVAVFMCRRLSLSARGRRMARQARLFRLVLRSTMLFLRSVPELIWALLFVSVTGLGATAGILGLMLTNIGILAKNYTEIIESADARVSGSLLDNGNGRFVTLLHGTLPQCLPECLSYSVYRWECTLRTSVVLGFVGAGGLGQELMISIRQLAAPEVFSIIVVFVALVSLCDGVSARWRRGLGHSFQPCLEPCLQSSLHSNPQPGLQPDLPSGQAAAPRLPGRQIRAVLLIAVIVACFALVDWQLSDWLDPARLGRIQSFIGGFLPPDLSPALWQRLAGDAVETLGMAFAGTAVACLLALGLSYLRFSLALHNGRRCLRVVEPLLQGLQIVLRAIPELVWAMLLIILVGIGPFSGALALCLCSVGVLSRLYSECLDNQRDETLQNLLGNGIGAGLAPLWSTLVQARSQLISYSLYRWEHNLRAATLMGIVGAGGVGQELYLRLSVFQFDRVAACVVVILAMVALADSLSQRLRQRFAPDAAA